MFTNYDCVFFSATFCQKFRFFLPSDNIDTENYCDLKLFIPTTISDFEDDWLAPQIILLTQICETRGDSVTNAIEFISSQAVDYLKKNLSSFDSYNCIIIEHYNQNSYRNFDKFLETYDIFKEDEGSYYWHRLKKKEVICLIKGEAIPNYSKIPNSFYYHNWSENRFQKKWKFFRAFFMSLTRRLCSATTT